MSQYLIHHGELSYTWGAEHTAREAVRLARAGNEGVGVFSPWWPAGSLMVYALDKPADIARRIRALDAKHAPRGPGPPDDDGGVPLPIRLAA